jgi:hypothetical protein
MRLPSEAVVNEDLSVETGQRVILLDVLSIAPGETIRVEVVEASGAWRQGIWLGVDGELDIAGAHADQFEIWADTAPRSFEVKVLRTTDGFLRLYNIWDSGRGYRRESQSATSGMLKSEERVGPTVIATYRANDIGRHPAFDKLVFKVVLR